jgi:glycerophosphoryl diester phosphodiesterase
MHPLLDLNVKPIVGHRGNAAHAPENTIESFRQAVEIGVDALELDVHLTADGHVVVIHDPTLDRTTNLSGRVDRHTLDELGRADAGASFTKDGRAWPYRGRGLTIPTFAEVLAAFPAMPLLIEIKAPAASRAVRETIERHNAVDRCIVAAFRDEAMTPFEGSRIAQGASRRDTAQLLWRALVRLPPARVSFDVMCMPRFYHGLPLPVAGYASILAARGVPVHVWTVDDPREARALRQDGVRGIISNDPAAIIAGLAR